MRINLSIMSTIVKPQIKGAHKNVDMGVVIIFIIVTLIFLLSLTQTKYIIELFRQKTEIKK